MSHSFQMANMFHECIGRVDIISDAENIKNLCKIPYNKKSVSNYYFFLYICKRVI